VNYSKLALFGVAATLVLALGNAAFGQAVRGDEPAAEPVPSPSKSVSPAAAETAAPTSPELAEIVVTAEHRNENIQHVPIAVTAITGNQITYQGIVTNQDLQLVTPGMTFRSSYALAQPYIRGIGTNQPNTGIESAVASYVDGAYQFRSLGQIGQLYDMQDIQVLKGAQGTLWGRNATGGAILYTTAQPVMGEFSGNVSAEYGNYQHTLGEIALNIPLGDQLALRIGGQGSWDEGYITNITDGEKWGGGSHGLGRATLKWQPTDEFSATLMHETDQDNRHINAFAFAERAPFPQCQPCGLPGGGFNPVSGFYNIAYGSVAAAPFSDTSETTILTLAYNGAFIDVNSVTSYQDNSTNGQINLVGSSIPYEIASEDSQGGKTWGEELQAVSHLGGMFDGMLGVSVSADTGFTASGISGLLFQNVPGINEFETVATHSYSGFGELYAQPVEHLKFTFGVRYTDDHRTLTGADSQNAAAIFATNSFSREATFSEVTPRFVAAYDFGSVNLYASYNRGFKEGGFNTPTFTTEAPVKSETVDYYEAGAKFISQDRRLQLNAAAYYYKYKDIQVAILDVQTGANILENAAAARAYGAEFEASYNVAQWLSVFGNISLLNAKYTSYSAAAVVNITPTGIVPTEENLDGFRLPNAPSFLSSLGGDLHVPIADHLTAHFNALAHYTSSYDFYPGASGPQQYARQDPYWLVNLSGYIEKELSGSIGPFHPKYYRVGLYANNATDTHYYTLRVPQALAGLLDSAAPPATYGLRVSVGL